MTYRLKRKNKLSLSADGMIVQIVSPKETKEKLLELISKSIKVAGFLYTSNEQLKLNLKCHSKLYG